MILDRSGDRAAASAVPIPLAQSMIPKKPAPDLIRGGYRFSEKACPRESGGHAPTI